MKTLQLLPALDEGGVECYVVTLCSVLAAAGWETVVASTGGKLVAAVEAKGARHIRLPLKGKNPFSVPGRVWRLRRLLKRERPDLVVAHSRVPAWLAFFALKGLGIPWITYAHGANSPSRYSRVMTCGNLVMCPSRFVADHLKAHYSLGEERLRVVSHAVDAAKFDPAKVDGAVVEQLRLKWRLDGRPVVMAVGRITPLKGYATLLRAFAAVLKAAQENERPEPKLVIVGGAEESRRAHLEELQCLAAELGISEHVVFAGAQTRIPECLTLASVVVSANVRKPEAFGLSMVEALAMERPVVARAFGGALDIVRDGIDGELVRETELSALPAAFAQAIERALGRTYAGLRAGALERFDFQAMAKRTLAVYRELAGQGGAE